MNTITSDKRKKIEKLIFDFYSALDPSGNNSERYRNLFADMNDKEFNKFINDILSNDKENFILGIVELEHSINMENAENAAKVLNIPLMEYVYMPHLSKDKNNSIVSKEKCLVGYFNVKRTQQLLHKKNGLSISNEKRSMLTGQVTGDDKNARNSDIEASILVSLGAEHILQELHGPRADDHVMQTQMNTSIKNKGYALLEEMDNFSTNKITLNTINVFLLSMGLMSDLVTDTYILPKTSDELFG